MHANKIEENSEDSGSSSRICSQKVLPNYQRPSWVVVPGANWDLCLDIGTVAERLIERDEKIGNRHFACKPISQSALQRQTKSQITDDFENCKQITSASKQTQFDPQLTLKMVPDESKEIRKMRMKIIHAWWWWCWRPGLRQGYHHRGCYLSRVTWLSVVNQRRWGQSVCIFDRPLLII